MASWFKVRKAAQIAAFFAHKQGGSINLLKLVKLIYLANRRAMEKYDYPLIDDLIVSMDQGPVNSTIYDYINGVRRQGKEEWEEFVTGRADHSVGLRKRSFSVKDLDELSDADIATLSKTWDRFGNLDQWALVKYTHRYCPEWEDPHGTSVEIPYERIFKALGKRQSGELDRLVRQRRQLTASISR